MWIARHAIEHETPARSWGRRDEGVVIMAATTALQRADRSMLDKARALRDLLAAQGAANEEAGALSETTLAALHEGGFFAMFVPASLGGAEVTPTEALQVIEALCEADASTG
jgi:indole-3-acetate monooxygenase